MAGLKLVVPETFKSTVEIRVPGGGTFPVEFVFKYRTSAQLVEFVKEDKWRSSVSLPASIQMLAEGWDLEDEPFNDDGLNKLFDLYSSAPSAIATRYFEELGPKAKLGN